MGPLLAVALRWAVAGIAMGVGVEIGKMIYNKANEDEWISKGIDETAEDLKHTWTGRSGENKKDTECKEGWLGTSVPIRPPNKDKDKPDA
jgi:hypothetical protein